MAGNKDKSSETRSSIIFTVDNTGNNTEIPTITKLLNRKKLIKASSTGTVGAPGPGTSSATAVPPPTRAAAKPKIQKVVKRKAPSAARRLILWSRPELTQAQDDIGRALNFLCEKGVIRQALFLKVTAGSYYRATHGLDAAERQALWSGLSFHPNTAPDLWQALMKSGVIELTSGGSATSESASFMRNLLGLFPEDHLTLFRCGTATRCHGILVVISEQSMGANMQSALRILDKKEDRKGTWTQGGSATGTVAGRFRRSA